VSGSRRSRPSVDELEALGVRPLVFDGRKASEELGAALRDATHLLVGAPPDDSGDPLLRHHRAEVENGALEWLGYLSTTGVYGDHGGVVVDEETPTRPGNDRSRRRVDAEEAWSDVARGTGVPLQRFRLSGIYGPGRSVLDRLRKGTARRLVAPDLVFNRIHVDDIAGAVVAGIDHGEEDGAFNVSDDLPAPPAEVVEHAARLLGLEPPPAVPLSGASLSEAARTFYEENKRVDNERMKSMLGYRLRYPTYREGLAAILGGHP